MQGEYKMLIKKSKSTRGVFLFTLFFLFLSSLNAEPLVKRTQVLMGTYVSISLAPDQLERSKDAFERIKEVELALSSYAPESRIYQLNHQHRVYLLQDTYEALLFSQKYYKQTGGYFDITIGSITKGLFHFGEEERIPSKEELKQAKVDFKGLHFTPQEAWTDKGIVIDLGGMGKGFAVDKAVEVLEGIDKAVISLSGDIYCIGRCSMQVQDPFQEKILASFMMKNMAISSSGNYRRFVKKLKYNHLINPKKRASQRTFASITLISNRYLNSDLDAYATAASVMPFTTALRFLKRMEIAYLLVRNDKKVIINKKFKKLTQNLKLFLPLKQQEKEYIRVPPLTFQSSKKQ